MTILTSLVVLVAVVGVAAFLHLTREFTVSAQDIQIGIQQTDTAAESGAEVVLHNTQLEYTIRAVSDNQEKIITGTTSQITGDIHLDLNHLPEITIDEINLNVCDFMMDDVQWEHALSRSEPLSDGEFTDLVTLYQRHPG